MIGRRARTCLVALRDFEANGRGGVRPVWGTRPNAPFGGCLGDDPRIPSFPMSRTTRAYVVDLDAAKERDGVAVFLVGGIGILGIALMLVVDMLVFQAF